MPTIAFLLLLLLVNPALSSSWSAGSPDALPGGEGRAVAPEASQQTPVTCAHCGEVISGSYVRALGKNWHPEHFVCAHCGKQLPGRFHERDGLPYCEDDFIELFSTRCTICGRALRGEYLVNHWGDTFCPSHKREMPECFSCGRLVKLGVRGAVQHSDGRVICGICQATAVSTPREGARVMAEVRRDLAAQGVDLGLVSVPLRLVDRPELKRLTQGVFTSRTAGLTLTLQQSVDGQVTRREVQEVLILNGLPREHFASVAAHELGHAWLFLNGYPALSPEVSEGLCELLQYLWLGGRESPEAEYRLKVLDEGQEGIYGAGFQKARRALQGRTLTSLLDYVKEHARFPTERRR